MPEIIIVPSLFFLFGFIVWIIITSTQRSRQMKLVTEFNSRLLDRFGTVKDFADFLQTEAGSKFMNSLTVERSPTRPQGSILRAVQVGIVMLALGIGLLVTSEVVGFIDEEPFIVLGAIAVSLGVGFILAAIASFRLARSLGVIDRTGE